VNVQAFVDSIVHSRHYREQIVHDEQLPAREACFAEPAEPIQDQVRQLLSRLGIERLYSHQAAALDAVRRRENLIVVTGTASGKTLCYNIPVLEAVVRNPSARAIYLFPTKALAQDQLKGLRRFTEGPGGLPVKCGTYDGDTPQSERRTLCEQGRIILTNPDMLHSGVLPNHSRWAHFFENLEYVVVDEVHTYRGLFGANVGNVLRRLRRVCRHYGSNPVFILCSATIGNPKELGENLLGMPVTPIDNDGSPRGRKTFLLWNPPHMDEAKMERRSPSTDAHYMLCDLVRQGCQTLAFVRARVTAEMLYRMTHDRLLRDGSRLANSVRAYRGGYIASTRREIEQKLFSGELLGVVSTNALELGIDIGSMEACLLVGYPGTVASLWQQAGRAGRGTEDSLAILFAYNEPIDQFLVNHPSYIFGRTPEEAIVDALNPHVVALHLRCAAKELPVTAGDEGLFGAYLYNLLELLEDKSEVTRRGDRWFWAKPGAYPARDFSLRIGTDNVYQIMDVSGPEPNTIGETDELSAYHMVHTQAIYLHQGETYFVRELNIERKHAYIEKGDFDYYTQSIDRVQIRVDEVERERDWRVSKVGFGDVTVTELVYMFRKMKFGSRDSIGFGNLDLPPYPLETVAMWLIPPAEALVTVRRHGRSPQDGLLGISNVLASVMSFYVMCDRGDIGTTIDSMNFGTPTLFAYDEYPGGAGFAQRSYERIEELLEACLDLVSACPCEDGCPSCVGAPDYDLARADATSRAAVPDKEAALCFLHHLLEREPYIPKPVEGARTATMLPPEGTDDQVMGSYGTAPVPVPPDPQATKRLPEVVVGRIRRRLADLG
jgi:DEAD/DEAH box helicase domain-containing protein